MSKHSVQGPRTTFAHTGSNRIKGLRVFPLSLSSLPGGGATLGPPLSHSYYSPVPRSTSWAWPFPAPPTPSQSGLPRSRFLSRGPSPSRPSLQDSPRFFSSSVDFIGGFDSYGYQAPQKTSHLQLQPLYTWVPGGGWVRGTESLVLVGEKKGTEKAWASGSLCLPTRRSANALLTCFCFLQVRVASVPHPPAYSFLDRWSLKQRSPEARITMGWRAPWRRLGLLWLVQPPGSAAPGSKCGLSDLNLDLTLTLAGL